MAGYENYDKYCWRKNLGMTEEYYLLERYADNDPYFVPWLPNASANGRLMMMLEDIEQSKLR